MYYYAFIDPETGVCLFIEEQDQLCYEGEPYYVLLDYYDDNLITRKKYVNGQWVDTTPNEAQREQAKYIGINGEWLDDKIVAMDEAIENHTHDGYASSTHTHAANMIGAVATSDVATVLEAKGYLGI